MEDFRIEKDSPIVDLRPSASFDARAATWLSAAHELVSNAVADDRAVNGSGEEVAPLLTNRQADHLAMGLGILAAHHRSVADTLPDSTPKHAALSRRLDRLMRPSDPAVPDGLYRLEFTYGERRGGLVVCFDFVAEVFDGAGKGLRVGETFSFSFGRVTGAGNEQKIRAYSECLGVDSSYLDHEEWLLRPFLAEVVGQRIVAISDGKSAFVHLPSSAESPRKMVWRADTGWDFQEPPLRSGASVTRLRAA